jgi:hypothetical protein
MDAREARSGPATGLSRGVYVATEQLERALRDVEAQCRLIRTFVGQLQAQAEAERQDTLELVAPSPVDRIFELAEQVADDQRFDSERRHYDMQLDDARGRWG